MSEHHEHSLESCRHYLECIGEYVDGELSQELCQELEEHMAVCSNCRVVVNTLSKTISLYHRLPTPEIPSGVRERLYKVLDLSPYIAPKTDE